VIQAAKLVEDAAANARDRKRAEGQTARRIEILERVHEADRTGTHELIELDACRKRPGQLPRDVMNQIQVLRQQCIAGGGISGGVSIPKRNVGTHGNSPDLSFRRRLAAGPRGDSYRRARLGDRRKGRGCAWLSTHDAAP
jgi:hypothetical protein